MSPIRVGRSGARKHHAAIAAPSVATAVRSLLRGRRAPAILVSTAACLMSGTVSFAEERAGSAQESDAGALDEIVVSAQRREQSVQEIPYNISVVSGADIAKSGATNINDLARVVNGLVTVDQGPVARSFRNDLTLRGLRTDSPGGGFSAAYLPTQTVNSVSTYFGETPIFFPMMLEDIERVEVLRGPQGTLYGSGAQAGTIRVIPRRPELSGFDAEISGTGSYTDHSSRPNSNLHGYFNIPLADTLALRLVAGREHLEGFIDAVSLWETDSNRVPIPSVPGDLTSAPAIAGRKKDVNSSDQWFGRAALRWKPSDAVDLQLDYLHQETTQDSPQVSTPFWTGGCVDVPSGVATTSVPDCTGAPSSAFYAPAAGKYATGAFSEEPYDDTVDLVSLVANIDLSFASLTSATSYDKDSSFSSVNIIASATNLGAGNPYCCFAPYNGYPRMSFIAPIPATDKSFVQEVRLASRGVNRFDYVVGAYYQRATRDSDVQVFDYGQIAYNDAIGLPTPTDHGDLEAFGSNGTVYEDKALFGELTAHLTPSWQVTAGLRVFRDTFSVDSDSSLPLCGSFCSDDLTDPNGRTTVSVRQKFSDHLTKINTSYDLGKDTKIYATYSEGFRRGGTNGLPVTGPFAALPEYQIFTPDFAKNYEVGLKGMLLDKRIRYSTALFLIDLKNFQFNGYSNAGAYAAVFNGSAARTKGVELEMQAAVTDRLLLSAGYAYTEAKTASDLVKSDLNLFALIPEFGGGGPNDTSVFINLAKGIRLPGVPRHAATFGVDYEHPLPLFGQSEWSLLLHADAAYRSSSPGGIDVTRVFFWEVPSSTTINARASLNVSEHLRFDLFANNITSETAYSGASYVQTHPNPYQLRNVARPRTVGLTVRYSF